MAKEIIRKGVRYLIFDDGTACVKKLNKKDIENLVIPNEIDGFPVTGIYPKAFYEVHCLSISLPETIANIPNATFYHCWNLKEIEFRGDNSDVKLDHYAIAFCNELETIKCNRNIRKHCKSTIVCCPKLVLTD